MYITTYTMAESMLMRDIRTKMIISAWIGRISICYPLPTFSWLPMGMHKKYPFPSISLYYMRTWIVASLSSEFPGGGGTRKVYWLGCALHIKRGVLGEGQKREVQLQPEKGGIWNCFKNRGS